MYNYEAILDTVLRDVFRVIEDLLADNQDINAVLGYVDQQRLIPEAINRHLYYDFGIEQISKGEFTKLIKDVEDTVVREFIRNSPSPLPMMQGTQNYPLMPMSGPMSPMEAAEQVPFDAVAPGATIVLGPRADVINRGNYDEVIPEVTKNSPDVAKVRVGCQRNFMSGQVGNKYFCVPHRRIGGRY